MDTTSNGSPTSSYRQATTPTVDSMALSRPLHLRRRKLEIDVFEHGDRTGPRWQFPTMGTSEEVHVPLDQLAAIQRELDTPRTYLRELPATAICGNDILASVLYSASSVAAKAGKLMPVPVLLVSIVLFAFRFIYEEVVTAIPLNGGHRTAAVAACLSILSYVATAVASATTGVRYLNNQVTVPIVGCTILLLGAFALLTATGMSDSSRVAVGIFLHHVFVLSLLLVACIIYTVQHAHIFVDNMHTKLPPVDFAGSMSDGNVGTSIFFGFGASMLGITGFETSSNYVEEQARGVFRKTLRNMWAFVTFFNVGLAMGILGVMPLEGTDGIYAHSDALLAKVGHVAMGPWFATWICVDAFLVLSGSVLTSYIGICGLVRRLASDRVLPAFLIKQNKWRGTNHYIIGLFFLLSSSLVVLLHADATSVNGVYTYAFLGLLAMFSFACLFLKAKRAEIPSDMHASTGTVLFGLAFVLVGLLANLLGAHRVTLLRCVLVCLQHVAPSKNANEKETASESTEQAPCEVERTGARGGRTIARTILSIRTASIAFFCKRPDLTILNKAILYVRRNEQTHTLRIVHVFRDEEDDAPVRGTFRDMTALFDAMYPKLRIDFVAVRGDFGPAMIEWLARYMHVPCNMMFITQPDRRSADRVSTAGGRVITA
ncbi:hypothetical protein PsorP6_018654 [Peronosclerospora sorghi]|nr:hypothetical protein PsorP6_018674 [Peronosclerospora sorghi]KAI9895611.1 hypothetical protein PsorP6_018654 [Peronosclerospora sorghi]